MTNAEIGFNERFGPWAIVTGAGKGVGLAFTTSLLARGVSVAMVDRDGSVVETAEQLDAGSASSVIGIVADCADPAWIDQMEHELDGREVGLVVANAAASVVGPFLGLDAQSRRSMIEVNCTATADLAAWALPPMVERGCGGLVATSSGSALAGTAAVSVYSATKAFILNLCEALAWELAESNIAVRAVVAPMMDTPGFRSSDAKQEALMGEPVEPAAVTEMALDSLAGDGDVRCLADPGLEFMAEVPRAERSRILSEVTHAMYSDRF